MSMVNFMEFDVKNNENLNVFGNIDGDEDNLEYLVKMLTIKLKEEINQRIKSPIK